MFSLSNQQGKPCSIANYGGKYYDLRFAPFPLEAGFGQERHNHERAALPRQRTTNEKSIKSEKMETLFLSQQSDLAWSPLSPSKQASKQKRHKPKNESSPSRQRCELPQTEECVRCELRKKIFSMLVSPLSLRSRLRTEKTRDQERVRPPSKGAKQKQKQKSSSRISVALLTSARGGWRYVVTVLALSHCLG